MPIETVEEPGTQTCPEMCSWSSLWVLEETEYEILTSICLHLKAVNDFLPPVDGVVLDKDSQDRKFK